MHYFAKSYYDTGTSCKGPSEKYFRPAYRLLAAKGGGGPAKAAKKLENGMKSSHEAKVFENHMSMESFHVNTTSSIVR